MIDLSRRTTYSLLAAFLLISSAVAPAAAEPWVGTQEDNEKCVPDAAQVATGAIGLYGYATGCYDYITGTNVNTTETDASQTKVDIYADAQNAHTNADLLLTAHENHLQDSQSVALMIGKNAYIRAMNNGSSQAAAETAAKQAVADYYTVKQIEILTAWESHVEQTEYMADAAENESGVSRSFALVPVGTSTSPYGWSFSPNSAKIRDGTATISLANGSTRTATRFEVKGDWTTDSGYNNDYPMHFGIEETHHDFNGDKGDYEFEGWAVQPPNDNYDQFHHFPAKRYQNALDETRTQNDDVQSQMETLVNQTYSEYQAGMINNSDLVDPYLMQREYAPNGSFQAWAASTLTTMGVNSPEALDSMGHFNVTTPNASYRGMLMSETNPASGSFAINGTYNASNITGQQYVVTASDTVELTGEFTISDIRDTSGEQVQNVTIEDRDYSTVNLTEYRNVLESLREERAQIEAREQNIRNDGGGFVIGENSSLGLIVLGAGGLLLLYGRSNGGNGGNGGFP